MPALVVDAGRVPPFRIGLRCLDQFVLVKVDAAEMTTP